MNFRRLVVVKRSGDAAAAAKSRRNDAPRGWRSLAIRSPPVFFRCALSAQSLSQPIGHLFG